MSSTSHNAPIGVYCLERRLYLVSAYGRFLIDAEREVKASEAGPCPGARPRKGVADAAETAWRAKARFLEAAGYEDVGYWLLKG